MANKYWRSTIASGSWNTAANWSLNSSTPPYTNTNAPTSLDDVFFESNATVSFTGSASCRLLKIRANVTFNAGSVGTISISGDFDCDYFTTVRYTGTTAITMVGSAAQNIYPSSDTNLQNFRINKATGVWATLQGELKITWNTTNASRFFHTTGNFNLNGNTMWCRYYDQSATGSRVFNLNGTVRNIGQTGNIVIGTASPNLVYTDKSGWIEILPDGGTGTIGCVFHTQNRSQAPRVKFGNNRNYTVSGNCEEVILDGAFVSTTNIGIFGGLTGTPTVTSMITGVTVNIYGEAGQSVSYPGYDAIFGTVGFSGFLGATGITFDISNLRAGTINCNSSFCTYNINLTANVTGFTSTTLNCNGLSSTYNYNGFYDQAASTINMGGNASTVHHVGSYVTFDTIGSINFTIGTLQLDSTIYCRFFNSNTANNRVILFQFNWIRVGHSRSSTGSGAEANGTGAIAITGTSAQLTSDAETTWDGGFWLSGSGTCTLGTWGIIHAPRFVIEAINNVGLTANITSGNVRRCEIQGSVTFGSSTIAITREDFVWNGQGTPNLTNLTLDHIHTSNLFVDFRPSEALSSNPNLRIGTFRIPATAGANLQWQLNVYCRFMSLLVSTGDFYLDDVNFVNQITASGINAIYHYNTVINNTGVTTSEQITMGGGASTQHRVEWYDVNVNGIINHSIGLLHLDWDLNCRTFRSNVTANTRIWEFNGNWINTTGSGIFDIAGSTAITSDAETSPYGGGFRVRGSGSYHTFGTVPGIHAPRIIFDPQGGTITAGVSSGNVREVYLEAGTLTFLASSVMTFVRSGMNHAYGTYNTVNLTCIINFVTSETFDYTYTRIATLQVSGAPTGLTYNLGADCNTLTISSGSNTYNLNNITHGVVTLSGGSATYNCNYLRQNTGAGARTLSGTGSTYNLTNWQALGTITHSAGTVNLTSNNNLFDQWQSTSGLTRRLQANGYFIYCATSVNFQSGITGFTSDSNGGFEMDNGNANLTAILSTDTNAFDFRIYGNMSWSFGGTVNTLILGGGAGITGLTQMYVRKNVIQGYPWTTVNSLSNLRIYMVSNGTYDADTPSPVGLVVAQNNGQSITVNNMYASQVDFTGATSNYTINNATAITILNCSGSGSTYNLLSFSGTTVNLTALFASGTPVYNIGSIVITGSAVGQGLQFQGGGNLNLVGNPSFYRINSNVGNTRSFNFGSYFIIMEAGGNVNIANTSFFSSTETGGGWRLRNNNTMDMGILASGASMNVQFQGVLTLSTPGNTFIKTLQNYWDGDLGTPGYINTANFTLTVYGGVKLAGDGNLNYGNWSTTNITVINNDTAANPSFTSYPSGASGSVTIPNLDVSGAGVTRNLVGNLYVGTFTFNSGSFNLNNNTIFATTCTLNSTTKSIASGTSGKIQTINWSHADISAMTWTGTGYIEVYNGTLNNGGTTGATTNIANFRIAGNPTVNNNFYANNLILVGWTPNSSLYRTYIAGNLTYSGGMDSTAYLHTFEFIGTNAASVSTTAAMTNSFPRFIISGGKTLTIQNSILASIIQINASNTLNTNDQAITIDNSVINNGTVTLGSSIITMSSNSGSIWSGSASQIVNGGTSEIKFTGTGSFDKTVYFGTGNTLNKLTNGTTFSHSGSGDGTGWLIIQSDNLSIALVAKNPGAYSAGFKFTNQGAGIAKVTAFSIDGISGFPTYVQGPITKPGTVGTMTFNWLGVKNSVVSGGAPPGWYANSSIDYGGNTGWIFAAPVNTNNGNGFFVFF